MTTRGRFLRLSEHINALDYLEKAQTLIYKTDEDATPWKWVIIALHGGVYGFAICALEQGNVLNVIKRDRKSTMKKLEKGTPRLISFSEPLRGCQEPPKVGQARALNLSQRGKQHTCRALFGTHLTAQQGSARPPAAR